jgi:hypothetical protein
LYLLEEAGGFEPLAAKLNVTVAKLKETMGKELKNVAAKSNATVAHLLETMDLSNVTVAQLMETVDVKHGSSPMK